MPRHLTLNLSNTYKLQYKASISSLTATLPSVFSGYGLSRLRVWTLEFQYNERFVDISNLSSYECTSYVRLRPRHNSEFYLFSLSQHKYVKLQQVVDSVDFTFPFSCSNQLRGRCACSVPYVLVFSQAACRPVISCILVLEGTSFDSSGAQSDGTLKSTMHVSTSTSGPMHASTSTSVHSLEHTHSRTSQRFAFT